MRPFFKRKRRMDKARQFAEEFMRHRPSQLGQDIIRKTADDAHHMIVRNLGLCQRPDHPDVCLTAALVCMAPVAARLYAHQECTHTEAHYAVAVMLQQMLAKAAKAAEAEAKTLGMPRRVKQS